MKTDLLMLDFEEDNPQKKMSISRIGYVARKMRLPIKDVKAWRTSRGIHVRIWLKKPVHPITAVLIQALMNSDYARETHNAIRVYNLTLHPKKYSETAKEAWNVLFYRKIVKGKVVSEEVYDPELTEKLRRELIREGDNPNIN